MRRHGAVTVLWLGLLRLGRCGHTLTVYNQCPDALWPAHATLSGTAPAQPAGWKADSCTKLSFPVGASALVLDRDS